MRTGLDGRPLATWTVWEALGMVLLGFFLGTLAAVPVFSLMKDTTTQSGAIGPSELLQGVVLDGVLIVSLVVWLHRRHPTWRQILGLSAASPALGPAGWKLAKEIAIGAGMGLVVRLVAGITSVVVTSVLQHATGQSVGLPEQVKTGMSGRAIALFALYAVIVAPIAEELVFRGLIYRAIRDRLGVVAGAVLSAIPFGLIHYVGNQPWRDVLTLQLTMVVTGVCLALVFEWRKTIAANMASHAVFNLVAVVLIASGAAFVPGFLR